MTKGKQGDYEVGYGKPPRHTRFEKGKSGNPGGPKGSGSFAAAMRAEGNRRVTIPIGGKRVRLTLWQLVSRRIWDKAISECDLKAIALIDKLDSRWAAAEALASNGEDREIEVTLVLEEAPIIRPCACELLEIEDLRRAHEEGRLPKDL